MKNLLKILKYIFFLFIIFTVIFPSIFSFAYSIFNKSYLEEKEKNLFTELHFIEKDLSESVNIIGDYTFRRNISRIVNVDYSYKVNKDEMEELCKSVLEKNKWCFNEKVKFKEIDKEELFFKKEGYKMNVSFYDNNMFRIRITHDDIYSDINL